MRVLEVEAPQRYGLRERPMPIAQVGEALVRPLAVGICGSDVDLVTGTRPAAYVRYPIVPGHEWAGEVIAVAAGVNGIAVGDYVAVEGHNYCRVCNNCRQGATNLCIHYDEFGCTRDGGLAEVVAARADLLHPYHPRVAPELAALTEPTACALHGVEVTHPTPGATIVVMGPGTIGLLGTALFALYHPQRLIVLGRDPRQRDIALALGATDYLVGQADGWVAQVHDLTAGVGADIVYEAVGHPTMLNIACQLARRGGRIALEGVAGDAAHAEIEADVFLLRALTVHGIFAYTARHFERALRLIESGLLPVAPLITHRLALAHYGQGLALLEKRAERAIKVIIMPQA